MFNAIIKSTMQINSLHRQSGLNLIEILVAALILSVGLLSMAGLQVASLRSVQNATQKQQAAFIVHELLERMRSNRQAALDGSYNALVSCAAKPPLNCSANTVCSPAQLATYDLYTVQCGETSAATMRSGVNDQLLDGQLRVNCVATGCGDGVTVTLNWSELLLSEEAANAPGSTSDLQSFSLSVDAVI